MGVTQASAEERLELVPGDRDRGIGVMSPLILLLAEANLVPEERRSKRNPDRPCSSGGSKVVLTLLTEVVVVHVGLSAVYVRRAGLEFLSGCLGDGGSSSLQNGLKNPLQVILRVLGGTSISGRLFRLFGIF